MRDKSRASFLVILLVTLMLTSCSSLGVQPWQRGTLAREDMIFADSLDGRFDAHIYFSKEASTGGTSSSGGGCGCN